MPITRKPVQSPVIDMTGACVGCRDCKGMCQAVMDLFTFPDTVLNRTRPA